MRGPFFFAEGEGYVQALLPQDLVVGGNFFTRFCGFWVDFPLGFFVL